jgi:hypothetical protein
MTLLFLPEFYNIINRPWTYGSEWCAPGLVNKKGRQGCVSPGKLPENLERISENQIPELLININPKGTKVPNKNRSHAS